MATLNASVKNKNLQKKMLVPGFRDFLENLPEKWIKILLKFAKLKNDELNSTRIVKMFVIM